VIATLGTGKSRENKKAAAKPAMSPRSRTKVNRHHHATVYSYYLLYHFLVTRRY
jgi:hypothetical protein